MASSTQIALLRERTKTDPAASPPEASPDPKPAPADTRQPTSASLPILSPPHVPAFPVFSAPPAGLSPAQRAVQTRRAREAGVLPAKGEPAAKPALSPARPDGILLVLRIAQLEGGPSLSVTLEHRKGDGEPSPSELPEGERSLWRLSALATYGDGGELSAPTGLVFSGVGGVSDLDAALPVMRRATASLLRAYEDSEDVSFPQAILTLAGMFRVDLVEFTSPAGDAVVARRGAAYITAFKASEAFKPFSAE